MSSGFAVEVRETDSAIKKTMHEGRKVSVICSNSQRNRVLCCSGGRHWQTRSMVYMDRRSSYESCWGKKLHFRRTDEKRRNEKKLQLE